MKTALGYFFLSLAATLTGVALMVLFFALTGKLRTLDNQTQNTFHLLGLGIYGVIHIGAIFPLFYYGIKWIKKEVDYISPPTGEASKN